MIDPYRMHNWDPLTSYVVVYGLQHRSDCAGAYGAPQSQCSHDYGSLRDVSLCLGAGATADCSQSDPGPAADEEGEEL